MASQPTRREFLEVFVGGGALCLVGAGCAGPPSAPTTRPAGAPATLPATARASAGAAFRRPKVRVAKVYLGAPKAHWPTPQLDLKAEMQAYEKRLAETPELADVQYTVNELLTSAEQAKQVKEKLADADGILAVHLSMGVTGMLKELLGAGVPMVLFAAPYSGHEWTGFGGLQKDKTLAPLECMLTADYRELAAAVRPFRAIRFLKEAKVLNVTTRDFDAYAKGVKDKFGTSIVKTDKQHVLDAYNAVSDKDAQAEAQRWISGAEKLVEPSREEVFKSCKLALALQRVLDEEGAMMLTVDCYGSMWRQLPAYPCISHARMNSLGYGGVCESDLRSAMTQLLLQGLSGKPGFISDPTMDVSVSGIILAHCMGAPGMDGPGKEWAPYRLRSVMERQEGAVPQVFMRIGQRVTQAILVGTDKLQYFTGQIIATPDTPRGCRTQITVKIDGDAEKLWQNWSQGLHRVTCYGDLTKDLRRFCRFKVVELTNEA